MRSSLITLLRGNFSLFHIYDIHIADPSPALVEVISVCLAPVQLNQLWLSFLDPYGI